MFNDKLIAGVIGVSQDAANALANRIDDSRITLLMRPSLDAALGEAPDFNASESNGHANHGDAENCLVVAGPIAEANRQRVAEHLARRHPKLPIVFITPTATVREVVDAMRQGAFSVAESSATDAALTATIEEAGAEGRRTASLREHEARLRERMKLLTNPEHQVLDAMLAGLANKQIAQHLQIGLRTVELRRSKIMKKMEAHSLAELIKFICLAHPQLAAKVPEPHTQHLAETT